MVAVVYERILHDKVVNYRTSTNGNLEDCKIVKCIGTPTALTFKIRVLYSAFVTAAVLILVDAES